MTRSAAIKTLLAEAVTLHGARRFGEAHDAYQRVLAISPRDMDAIHGLALIAVDVGRPAEAIPLLARCIALKPNNVLYRISLGVALLAKGDAEEAAAHLLEVANQAPHLAEPRLHLARALGVLGRWRQALDVMRDTAARFPDRADVWIAKGNAQRGARRPRMAEASYRRALELKPFDADILNNLGVVLRASGRTAEAIERYRQALALDPENAAIYANLGNALAELGQVMDAEVQLRRAVALDPSSVDARCALANFLTVVERPQEAIRHFRSVLARMPKNVDAWANLGVATLATGDTAEAERCYRQAIALNPRHAEAHYNLAWTLLLTGRWAEGWEEYEWRWRMPTFSSRRRDFPEPLWDGSPIFDGALLLHAEQGLGDAIQFVRYATLAKKHCSTVIVECAPSLVSLFRAANIADHVIGAGEPLPPFTAHVPLMSLPRIFGTTMSAVPHAGAYFPTPDRIPARLQLPPRKNRLRVGLVWAGSADNKIDRRRSLPAALLAELVSGADADFVGLQVGARATEIVALPAEKIVFAADGAVKDFADTAALIAQLDLVIGVDTAVLHLAAAMGRPTWMLLPFMPDYRWLLNRVDSPWYAAIRLFRQTHPGRWEDPIARVLKALTDWQPFAA